MSVIEINNLTKDFGKNKGIFVCLFLWSKEKLWGFWALMERERQQLSGI